MVHLLIAIIYISFISLGLPDGLLGAAWPSMYEGFDVPLSYAGIVSMLISGCTVISALISERVIKKLGTGLTTALSVGMTAIALLGFSLSNNFWVLLVWGIPYGLGAGGVDAALNNYVALRYSSRHMSWLHCFWGVGCTAGPYIMSHFLVSGKGWQSGYLAVFILQIALTAVLFVCLPLWKRKEGEAKTEKSDEAKPIGLINTFKIKGVFAVIITFFCYCALESTVGLWTVSYIVETKGIASEAAAKWGSMFFLGITVGRFLAGFISNKLGDKNMIRLSVAILSIGVVMLWLPINEALCAVAFTIIGLGCAAIYPSIIHATPDHFGKENSQAVIGVQMASAYIGSTFVPPVFGALSKSVGLESFPIFVSVIFIVMTVFSEIVNRKSKA